MARKSIVIHFGCDKTGSTAIQSWLTTNPSKLKEFGIHYPIHSRSPIWAMERGLGSGNGKWVVEDTQELAAILLDFEATSAQTLFLSGEDLLPLFSDTESVAKLHYLKNNFSGDLRLVALVREPSSYLTSVYNQSVKTGGYFGTFSQFILGWKKNVRLMPTLAYLPSTLSLLSASGFDVRIRSFESMKNDLLDNFLKFFLEVPPSEVFPTIQRVNLPLGTFSLDFMRGLNSVNPNFARHFGWELAANPSIFVDLERATSYRISSEASDVMNDLILGFSKRLAAVNFGFDQLDYGRNDEDLSLTVVEDEKEISEAFALGQGLAKSLKHGFLNWMNEKKT
jgi:hypothetical protein